jgi:hypothetical protein
MGWFRNYYRFASIVTFYTTWQSEGPLSHEFTFSLNGHPMKRSKTPMWEKRPFFEALLFGFSAPITTPFAVVASGSIVLWADAAEDTFNIR